MHKIKLNFTLFTFCIIPATTIAQNNSSFFIPVKSSSSKFTEGIIYSRTSFPGHPLNDSLKKLDYESGDFLEQYNVIQALKKHQQSIKAQDEQGIKDVFFVSGIMVMPAYSKMYFTPTKALIKTDALGYHQEVLINTAEHTGKLMLADRNKTNQGTINFKTDDIEEVWQKYRVDAAQYSIQKTAETAIIAGFPCKKIIYSFGGTSRGPGVSTNIINMLPLKVTAWYSDELPPSINLIHTLFFELDKAVLKFEVEYDKNKKNKMLVEVTKLEPRKIEEEKFEIAEKAPVIEHKKGNYDAGMMLMQVMMYAISLLTK